MLADRPPIGDKKCHIGPIADRQIGTKKYRQSYNLTLPICSDRAPITRCQWRPGPDRGNLNIIINGLKSADGDLRNPLEVSKHVFDTKYDVPPSI